MFPSSDKVWRSLLGFRVNHRAIIQLQVRDVSVGATLMQALGIRLQTVTAAPVCYWTATSNPAPTAEEILSTLISNTSEAVVLKTWLRHSGHSGQVVTPLSEYVQPFVEAKSDASCLVLF